MTSTRADTSLSRIEDELRRTYPAAIANRIDPRSRYDVLFVAEAHGAVAVESQTGLLPAVNSAIDRAGLTCVGGLRDVPAEMLSRRVDRIVSVNPTGGDIGRLRDLARAA